MDREELLSRYAAGERKFGSADLRGLDLSGLNLSGIDFRSANLETTNLSRTNLSGAYMECTNLINTILVEANLRDCYVEGFINCDLRRANLDQIRMIEAPIRNCNMEGVSMRNVDFGSEIGIRFVNLRNSVLTGTKGNYYLADVDLTGAIGFDRHGVAGGYWNLTLPDGTFIADWEAE